jgi:hypothetical protein
VPEITKAHINRLIELEASIQYDESPPAGEKPFIVKDGKFPILISAPHGARTHRNNRLEEWHEEDEYTAGMAKLLGEICDVSVIAMVARSDHYDPNYHDEEKAEYKQKIRRIIEANEIKYVIDLHGAGKNSNYLASTQLVDLGLGNNNEYLDEVHREKLVNLIEAELGEGVTNRNGKTGFPAASKSKIRIALFCHNFEIQSIQIQSVQIEMRPQLRVAHRFQTASLYKNDGKYDADPNSIIHMLQALVDFIEYLKEETIK